MTDAELLKAARECVLRNGVRRSTLTDIARLAGVSRMTLYRRFPDVHSIVTKLMTSEFSAVLHRARDEEGSGTARERLITALSRCIRFLQEDPLLRRVLETDPELLLPYLVDELGSTQLIAERFLRQYLAQGHADGSIRSGDLTAQARMLLMMAQTIVISNRPVTSGIDPHTVTDELVRALEGALQPQAVHEHDTGSTETQ